MWCPNCQDEIAAEVSSDNRRIRCANCGSDLGTAENLPSTAKTREARELLKRWSNQSLLEPPVPSQDDQTSGVSLSADPVLLETTSPIENEKNQHETEDSEITTKSEPTITATSFADVSDPTQTSTSSGKSFRVDGAHTSTESSDANVAVKTASEPPVEKANPIPTGRTWQVHNTHNVVPAPHFNIPTEIQNQQTRKTNWASIGGQLLAYCGVGLITIGTALVLWGYFGGPENYAPTGWLVATAGQMLMFLGVITLVSGGLEQTTDEVSRQLEQIGNRLIRIEQKSLEQSLSGPNFSDTRISEQDAAAEKQAVQH